MTKKGTEIAEKKTTAVATNMDYGSDAGAGFEDVKGSDLSIPFIGILQSNSPQVEACEDGSILSGMLINTVTGEITDGKKGFMFLPVHKEEAFVEWVPRIKGGGFVELHDPNGDTVQAIIKNNGGSRIPPKGEDGKRIPFRIGDNELIETFYVYGLVLNEEGDQTAGFAVIRFTSTKIKPYRDWSTSIFMLKGKPPMFANRAHIKTIKKTNDAGTFGNFDISPLKDTWQASLIHPVNEKALLEEGKNFQEMVVNGLARANFESQQPEGGESVSDKTTGGAPDTGSDENIPF